MAAGVGSEAPGWDGAKWNRGREQSGHLYPKHTWPGSYPRKTVWGPWKMCPERDDAKGQGEESWAGLPQQPQL